MIWLQILLTAMEGKIVLYQHGTIQYEIHVHADVSLGLGN